MLQTPISTIKENITSALKHRVNFKVTIPISERSPPIGSMGKDGPSSLQITFYHVVHVQVILYHSQCLSRFWGNVPYPSGHEVKWVWTISLTAAKRGPQSHWGVPSNYEGGLGLLVSPSHKPPRDVEGWADCVQALKAPCLISHCPLGKLRPW